MHIGGHARVALNHIGVHIGEQHRCAHRWSRQSGMETHTVRTGGHACAHRWSRLHIGVHIGHIGRT